MKISEMTTANDINSSDILILETSSGIRKIPWSTVQTKILNTLSSATIDFPEIDSAASHNAIFRGKDLTNIYNIEEICERISSGTFEDLYIGDYFDVAISTSYTANETVRCVLAGFDMYLNNGDTALTDHHAVIVPKNCFAATAQMNSSNTISGGYWGSAMRSTVLPKYSTALKNALDDHVITYRKLLSSANANNASMAGAGYSGNSSGWVFQSVDLCLMSEVNVYGSTVFSSSFFDVGEDNLQFPLFALDPTAKICKAGGVMDCTAEDRVVWWLKAAADSTSFARVFSNGSANSGSASSSFGVRPAFLIG